MTTIKIKYELEDGKKSLLERYLKQFSNCLHVIYNRMKEQKLSGKQLRNLPFSLSNLELLDTWMVENAIKEAERICASEKINQRIVFGGKKNLLRRQKNLISKEEWKKIRLGQLNIVGEACKHGNRKFRISDDLMHILFQPASLKRKQDNMKLMLPNLKKGIKKVLMKLKDLQNSCSIPISYKLNLDYVYLTFDESKVFDKKVELRSKKNRVLAIDMNPNYIGWSVVDWLNDRDFNVVKSGCYSFKALNDKQFALKLTKKQRKELTRKERLALTSRAKISNVYFNNKRQYEILEVAKDLMNVAKSCQCEMVVCEDLNIKSQDRSKGKNYNRLCNSFFIRNAFVNNLNKRCNIDGIKMLKVVPQYSSFIGNFLYRGLKLPDPILASIEIGRRGYEFNAQYIEKTKEKSKTIVQPSLLKFNDLIAKSLEEFGIKENFKDLINLYYLFKKDSGMMYRVPFASDSRWSKFKCNKSYVSELDESSL